MTNDQRDETQGDSVSATDAPCTIEDEFWDPFVEVSIHAADFDAEEINKKGETSE